MRTPKRLKGYFVAAAVPSESRFADVIDSLRGFRTLADLQAHQEAFAEGDIIIAENHRFRVAPSGANDHDLTLPNGTKLYSAPFKSYIEEFPPDALPVFMQASKTGSLLPPTNEGLGGISAEYLDKMLEILEVDGAGVVTGYDFSGGNALRSSAVSAGFPMSAYRWHAIGWHNSYPGTLSITSGNWKSILSNYIAAIAANATGFPQFGEIDIINEQVDSGSPGYVRDSEWRQAAEADGTWTYDSAFWWMHVAKELNVVSSPATKFFINNYATGEQDKFFGFGSSPVTLDEVSQSHIWERLRWDVINGLQIASEYGGRIDGIGFQSHMRPSWALHNETLKWRLWEANMLELSVAVTEINIFKAEFADIGMTAGTPEANAYGQQYLEDYLAAFMTWANDLTLIQSWTSHAQGISDGAIPAFETNGTRTFVADAIANALASSPTKDVRRAARMTFYDNNDANIPFDLTGTVVDQASFGIRGTDLKVPWSHFKRRVNGILQNMSQTDWEFDFMFRWGGTPTSGHAFQLRDSQDNALVTVGFDGAQDLVLTTSAGTNVISADPTNTDFVRVALRYTGGVVSVAMSWRDTTDSAIYNADENDVISQTVTLSADADVIAFSGAGTVITTFITIYDETDLSESDAELASRSNLTSDFGSPSDASI